MKLLVFLLLPCLSLSKVSPGFGDCKQFFLEDKPPAFSVPAGVKVPVQFTTVKDTTVKYISAKEICQCVSYNDNNNKKQITYVYATLYNTDWRIPIYSAYVFRSENVRSVGRCDAWYIEPQLDDANAEPCMATQGYKRNIGNKQAVNCDYEGSGYDKGHLYPVQHTDNHLSMLATSTLTNAAPQNSEFNQRKWRVRETAVIKELEVCDKAYVVTGVVPDHNIKIPKDDANVKSNGKQKSNRVTVSKYYWRAYCCEKKNSQNKLEYTGKGDYGPDGIDIKTSYIKTVSIAELQDKLATDYGVQITIFPSQPNLPMPPPTPGTPQLSGGKRPWADEIDTDKCTDE